MDQHLVRELNGADWSPQRISESKVLSKPVQLGSTENLKILLTTKENNKAKRPHQAFLLLKDSKANLDTSFAFQVKDNGKAKVDLVRLLMTPTSSPSS